MTRKLERIELSETIRLVDIINGGDFGELVNITLEGMMIITDHEVPTHSIYQLSLQLPDPISGSNTLELGADCLWCRKAENFHRYWAGFHIIDISDQAISQLKTLLTRYAK